MLYLLDLLGTLAFAISGAFKAKGRELNIFGVISLGFITAVGGGTVRDLIMGRVPLFYLKDPNYALVAVGGAVLAWFVPTFFKRRFSLFRFLDSLGLATFVIIGVSIANGYMYNELSLMSFIASMALGVLTGCGGGVLRDAIMGDVPFALKHGANYINSAFFGSLIFYVLMFVNLSLAIVLSMAVTMVMREVISDFGIYKKVYRKINGNSKN